MNTYIARQTENGKKHIFFLVISNWSAAGAAFGILFLPVGPSERTIENTQNGFLSYNNHSHNSQIISISCKQYYFFLRFSVVVDLRRKRSTVVLVLYCHGSLPTVHSFHAVSFAFNLNESESLLLLWIIIMSVVRVRYDIYLNAFQPIAVVWQQSPRNANAR